MSRVLLIAGREIKERGKTKAFLITTMATLLLVVGLVVVPQLLGGPEVYAVGTVGAGNDEIVAAALEVGTSADEPGDPPSVEIEAVAYPDRASALEAMEGGQVDAVLIDGTEVVVESAGFGGSSLLSLLQRGAAAVELERLIEEGGQTAVEVIDVMTSDPLTTTTTSGDDPNDESRGLIAYAGLMLLYLAILVYGNAILSGVTEEKSNRVVEVLLSAVRPWELLAGKIIGIGVLGLSQFVLTVVFGLVALRVTEAVEIPAAGPGAMANLVLWFVLGFLIYAVLFGSVGALASRPEDAQNVAFPMSMIAVVGLFLSFAALGAPEGTAAIVGTFIPLTAPFVVPVRAALDAIPAWQYLLSVVITLATTAGLTIIGGRIYAGGLLQFGGRIGVRKAWRSAAE